MIQWCKVERSPSWSVLGRYCRNDETRLLLKPYLAWVNGECLKLEQRTKNPTYCYGYYLEDFDGGVLTVFDGSDLDFSMGATLKSAPLLMRASIDSMTGFGSQRS